MTKTFSHSRFRPQKSSQCITLQVIATVIANNERFSIRRYAERYIYTNDNDNNLTDGPTDFHQIHTSNRNLLILQQSTPWMESERERSSSRSIVVDLFRLD
ncbi:hypothetical protein AVEN_884-1 [Araneus ventricosus]|uniref:Uncharacterized protein n=1 Tax=Araneus ventricosus TaxID=182803 RepID=A0A4Y2DSK3_ARAVE|nr:hypothetical protein AVEN_884-1 [Araneus ventricosus]